MIPILVTGGAGYIGSHVCKALKQKGFLPVVLDNLEKGHRWAIQWGPFVHGDILDEAALQKVASTYPVEGIIHLAALSEVRESVETPDLYEHVNVTGTKRLLEWAYRKKIPYFVFSSTAAVYGNALSTPIPEDHLKAPLHPYGLSKLRAEQAVEAFALKPGFYSFSLRYFNAAGADPDGDVGEAHTPETHLIPSLLLTALKKKSSFSLYGEGTAIRDYVHVTDLARAHVQALLNLREKKSSFTLNLGSGKGYTVKEILQKVEEITDVKLKIEKHPPFPLDPPCLIADIQKAKEMLQWVPQQSDLVTLLQTAWKWYRLLA